MPPSFDMVSVCFIDKNIRVSLYTDDEILILKIILSSDIIFTIIGIQKGFF